MRLHPKFFGLFLSIFAVFAFALPSCDDSSPIGQQLTVLCTGDAMGEIYPCG